MPHQLDVQHLDHCSILITDLERSRKFYRDLLGLKEINSPRTFNFTVLWFDLGNQHLHMLQRDSADPPSPRHFALRVRDVAAARMYFHERGIPVEETTPFPGSDRFFINDPDGNRIEIIQWYRTYNSEENAPGQQAAF